MEVRVSTRQTICPKMVRNVERSSVQGKTCHVPYEGPVYDMNRVQGEAETLHVGIAPVANGVADIVTHDGNIIVELLFPFFKDLS